MEDNLSKQFYSEMLAVTVKNILDFMSCNIITFTGIYAFMIFLKLIDNYSNNFRYLSMVPMYAASR